MKPFTKKCILMIASALALAACQQSPRQQVDIKPITTWEMAETSMVNRNSYDLGKSYLQSSSYGLAIDAFRQDLHKHGDSVATLNALAITYDMLGRFDLSQKYYERALVLEPDSSMTFSNLAYSQYMQQENENALILAYMAEELLAKKPSGDERISKVITTNREKAQVSKSNKDILEAFDSRKTYSIQRTGERNWEVEENRKTLVSTNKDRYKARISLADILERAKQAKAEKARAPFSAGNVPIPMFRIENGTGRPKMAKRVASFFTDRGLGVWSIGNATHYGLESSIIKYTVGYEAEAQKMAAVLPIPVKLVEATGLKARVHLVMGTDLLPLDESIFRNRAKI